MTIDQVTAFVCVAEHSSITRAADSLFLSQPSVTARLRSLEQTLGKRLVQRKGHGVVLTPAGRAFLPYAQQILDLWEAGRQQVSTTQKEPLPTHVVVGATPTCGGYVLPDLIQTLHATFPQHQISIRGGMAEEIQDMILQGQVHIGLVRRYLPHSRLQVERLFSEEFVLITPPTHPIAAAGDRFVLSHLSGQPLVSFTRRSGQPGHNRHWDIVESYLSRHGVTPKLVLDVTGFSMMKGVVERGRALAIVPYSVVAGQQDGSVAIRRLPDAPTLDTYFTYAVSAATDPVISAVIRLIRSRFQAAVIPVEATV